VKEEGMPVTDAALIRVLLVEDDPDQAFLVARTLRRQDAPFDVTVVGDGAACLAALAAQPYSIVLLDYSLPRESGLQVLAEIRRRDVSVPIVMVTAQGDERIAVEAMQTGAVDYLAKTPAYLTTLPTVIRKVLKQHELAQENTRLYAEVGRRLRESEGLRAVAHAVGQSLDATEIARQTIAEVQRLFGAEASLFFHVDENGESLRLVAVDGMPDGLAARGGEGGVAAAAPGADHARPAAASSPADGDAWSHPALELFQRRPSAFFYVPVLGHGGLLGAIACGWWAGPHAAVEEDLPLATVVASEVALALDNARLYAEARRSLADLKAAQEQLVRGETLRALGQVASGAAHHLNNLLAVVLGRVQLVLAEPRDPPAVERSLQVVQRAAMDAAEVVRRLQQFARAQPAEERRPVDLRSIVLEVVEMTRVRWSDEAQARGIEVRVTCETEPVPPVIGNAPALREVVTNLVLNAVDALPRGGRVVVRTFREGAHARLTVTDTGIGMAADVRQRVLEPFFTTKGPKGTGLGLSVSYGIVKSHGGELEIQSSPGAGTTVGLRLPIPAEPAEPRAPGPAAPAAAGEKAPPRRLLIVDDEESVRDALAAMAESLGHDVVPAASGREALALLESGREVDLVLTDLGMPGMTGRDLARAIKHRWPTLPLGMVTGWGATLEVEAADRAMVVGILAKPVLLGDMSRFIARATASAPIAASRA
jgi:signal transduction histidine kinase/DNA-binding response OmpR family regulator